MTFEFAIVGGGVAGLSAANRFADRGAHAVLIEAGTFPAHKICGEFLSPECLPILRGWGLEPPVLIRRARYARADQQLAFDLPACAGGFSRFDLDHGLARRAGERGVRVLTGTRITGIKTPEEAKDGTYRLETDSAGTIRARTLLVGTGRVVGMALRRDPPQMVYTGFKMHFNRLDLGDTLHMFAFPGVYLGIAGTGNGVTNLACLASRDAEPSGPDPLETLYRQPGGAALQDLLASAEPAFSEWMTTPIPEFGIREVPAWPRAMFIGDAAGSIPPATGNGLGMAMTGGIMAADMALDGRSEAYPAAWRARYGTRVRWGRRLHRVMMRPAWSGLALRAALLFPPGIRYMFNQTREPPGEAARVI